jgi:16S rRNA (adenine1518-N6/adenine1519-N6)-dimethyltransferase
MFQREVAERIVARPGSKAYGRLAVLVGWRAQAEILFDVDPRSFTPSPKVLSSVVHLTPRSSPLVCDAAALERVVAAAFGKRRKMLRQSLKALGHDTANLLETGNIDGTRRAEEIDVAGFVALANAMPAAATG